MSRLLILCLLLQALHGMAQKGAVGAREKQPPLEALQERVTRTLGYYNNRNLNPKGLDTALQLMTEAVEMSQLTFDLHLRRQVKFWLGFVRSARGEHDLARDILLPLSKEFGAYGDKYWQGQSIYTYAGFLTAVESNCDTIYNLYSESLEAFKMTRFKEQQYDLACKMGDIRRMQGRLTEAEAQLLSILEPAKKENAGCLRRIYRNLSKIHQTWGNYHVALSYALSAIEVLEKNNPSAYDLDLYNDIADLYYSLKDHTNEMNWHRKLHETVRKQNPQYLLINYVRFINGLIREGKINEAMAILKETAEKYPATQPWQKFTLACSYGNCYNALKQYDLAGKYYQEMMAKEYEDQSKFEKHFTFARFWFDRGAYEKARPLALYNTTLSPGLISTEEKVDNYNLLYRIDSALGNYASALQFLNRQRQISDSVFTVIKARQLAEINAKYETGKKDNALLLKDRDLQLREKDIELLKRDSALQHSLNNQRQKDIQLKQQNINMLQQQATIQQLATGKKDQELTAKEQHIANLKKQSDLQASALRAEKLTRNITIGGIIALLIAAALLYRSYRSKQAANKRIREQNKELSQLLGEKEWLLKEVHHRVKNNLHTVLSLLESQSRHLKNDALAAIRESRNRVYTMSLIHKKLYQGDDVAAINMKDYLEELQLYLRESISQEKPVRFTLDVASIDLDVSQAVPVGLIVNEAVTNALKYAFPPSHPNPVIHIQFNMNAHQQAMLTISDNGIGLPINRQQAPSEGLGLKLMRGLADDLDGSLHIETNQGTRLTLAFIANTPLHKSQDIVFYETTAN